MQALPAAPESLCIVEMGGSEGSQEAGDASSVGLYLNIGLQVSKVLRWEDKNKYLPIGLSRRDSFISKQSRIVLLLM